MSSQGRHDREPTTTLRESRRELSDIIRELRGDAPPVSTSSQAGESGTDFPRSRTMRALMGNHQGLMGGAAVALLVTRPQLAFKVLRWVIAQPVIRRMALPYIMRKMPDVLRFLPSSLRNRRSE